jgi:hypothetical protein
MWGEIEDLEKGAVKGDQIFVYKPVSRLNVFIKADLQKRADGIIGVKRKAVAVRGKDKEEVQKDFYLRKG